MQRIFHKLIIFIGILLILAGGFGWGYTYMIDHRSADNLSAYCDIDFKADVDEKGTISTANLTIMDYRYSGAVLEPKLVVTCDDAIFQIPATTRQLPPSYSIAFYNEKTTFKNSNKIFAEFPAESFDAIRKAEVVKVSFTYSDGYTIELPLNEHDLQYWKDQLQSRH
ncbi:MAG: hypothetical protein PUF95_04165 [Selenomonadaceae bacterium]|nr:hypothetical protein [Selenomonadaceae bacterium]MDD6397481.1 hypothetical protein [Selenomonadaceae bacterium]